MASQWRGSDRRERLPADWEKIRKRILRRDGNRCTHRDYAGERCASPATDVDHIVAGDDHRETNLRALCGWHHQRKSAYEGGKASQAKRRAHVNRFRVTESHPGSLA